LNPSDAWELQNLVFKYEMNRDLDAANNTVERALRLNPQGVGLWVIKAKLAISEKGDLSIGEKMLEKLKSVPLSKEEKLKYLGGRVDFLLLQRKYKDVLEIAESCTDDVLTAVPGSLAMKYFAIGLAEKGLGDDTKAREAFLKAKSIFAEQAKLKSDEPEFHIHLAKVNAWLGDKDAALAEAQRAMELRPESRDAFEGPQITAQVAEVYSILGDKDEAIEMLEGLLNRPSEVTVATLKLDPAWDPLRNDPRFQALLIKYGAKT